MLNTNKTQRQNAEQRRRMARINVYKKELAQVLSGTPKLVRLQRELAPLKRLKDADTDEELPNSFYLRLASLERQVNNIKINNREYAAYLHRKIQSNSY